MPKHLTKQQLIPVVEAIEIVFPESCGYTDPDTLNDGAQLYLVFRNRDESFNKRNAIASIRYQFITPADDSNR